MPIGQPRIYTRQVLVTLSEAQRDRLQWLAEEVGVTQAEIFRQLLDNATPAAIRQMLSEAHQRLAVEVMKAGANGAQLPLIINEPKGRRKQAK